MAIIGLLVLSIAPALGLMVYINYMDRHEKEPWGLILKVMLWGAVSVIPAVIVELLIGQTSPIFNDEAGEATFFSAFMISFVQVAPIEEICKLAPLLLYALRKPEFNEENDGIVYGGASALGFALLENIFYVLESGLAVGILRAVTALPMHCFTGVLMGYFIGVARFKPGRSVGRAALTGLLISIFLHGAYDTVIFTGGAVALVMLPLVIAMIIVGILLIRRGRRISMARWSTQQEPLQQTLQQPAAAQAEPAPAPSGRRKVYKVVISRILFFFCALLWAALLLAFFDQTPDQEPFTWVDLVTGGLLFTFLPTLIGVMLEISYYKN